MLATHMAMDSVLSSWAPPSISPAELKPVTAWGPAWLYEKASAQAGTSRSDRPGATTGLQDFLRKGAFPVTPGTQLNR